MQTAALARGGPQLCSTGPGSTRISSSGRITSNRRRRSRSLRHQEPQQRRQRSSAAAAATAAGDPAGASVAAQPVEPVEPAQPAQQQALPPYYALSLPVYSLATVGPNGATPTMNLVTYASPISLKPRHYALGLYLDTLSWANMRATRTGVLQVLGEQHATLFELLGRTSGRQVDKLAALAERGVPVSRREKDGIPLLGDSCGWIELRFAAEPVNYGDHDVVICEVTNWHTPAPGTPGLGPPLYTGHLRQLGLLS